MDTVKIQFFEKSFKVTNPVITPNVLFVRRAIDQAFQAEIGAFITTIIHASIKLGREKAQEDIREALGL